MPPIAIGTSFLRSRSSTTRIQNHSFLLIYHFLMMTLLYYENMALAFRLTNFQSSRKKDSSRIMRFLSRSCFEAGWIFRTIHIDSESGAKIGKKGIVWNAGSTRKFASFLEVKPCHQDTASLLWTKIYRISKHSFCQSVVSFLCKWREVVLEFAPNLCFLSPACVYPPPRLLFSVLIFVFTTLNFS